MSGVSQTQPSANRDVEYLRRELYKISAELGAGTLARTAATHSRHAPFIDSIRETLETVPKEAWPRLAVSFNEDQVESKLWLLEHLSVLGDLSEHRVVILGAWFGLLVMIIEQLSDRPPKEMCCVDVDEGVCALASRLLSVLSNPPTVLRVDMLALDHHAVSAGRPTIFINTSCEHLADFAGWRARVPAGSALVLQSNNHRGCSEHVNCVDDLTAFEQQARLSNVAYRGTLPLRHFTRFMVMGTA